MQQPSLRHPAARSGISLALFLTLLAGGCGGGGGYGGGGVPLATLSSIAITPSSAKITNAGTARLTAIGTYMDGTTADITTSATWTSTVPATGSVGINTGVMTAVAVGTTTITAAVGGLYGTVTSPPITVTVTADPVTGISVAPLAVSILAGTTTTLTATGTFADGDGNISGSVTWTSATPAVATVNVSGIVTGVSAGSSTITAESGVSATATVTVF